MRRLRARLLVGCSLVATLLAVSLIPLAVLSISDPERALFVHLASGLGPWHLSGAVVFFAAVAVALLTWALRDLARPGAPSRTTQEAPATPNPGPPTPPAAVDTIEPEREESAPERDELLRQVELQPGPTAAKPNSNAGINGTPRP